MPQADMVQPRVGLFAWLADSGMANLAIRGMALGFRFALAFYIVSFLGLEAAGIFGLSAGAAAIVPAVIGWGLNYYVSREVVGFTPAKAAPLVRNRLIITGLSLTGFTLIALSYMFTSVPQALWFTYMLIIILTWFETIGLDLQLPLIGLDMAFEATFLQFIRTAVWIPLVLALGLFVPSTRTLNIVFIAWIIASIVSLVILALILRRWNIREQLREPVKLRWAWQRFQGNWFIYLSDLGLVGFSFVDRYIVSFMLGLTATGIYSFYWSITNALQTLIATAVVQIALPKIVSLFRASDIAGWRHEIRRQLLKTVTLSVIMGTAIIGMTWSIIHFSPPGSFPDNMPLLFIMTLASVARSCSDLLNIGITSAGRDRYYAATNFLGMVITIALCFVLAHFLGLIGIALTALVSALILSAVRFSILRNVARHHQ